MKISVIVSTFNSAKTIVPVISAILAQSFKPYEIFVVDDKSTDNTVEVLAQFPEIKVFVLDKNYGGPARPRNQGIKLATGDFIAFCDADDIWHVEKLQLQVEAVQKSRLGFVSTDREIIKANDEYNTTRLITDHGFELLTAKDLMFRNPIVMSSVLVSKSIIKNYEFLEDERLVAVEDYEIFSRILLDFQSIKLKAPLVGYLDNGQGISSKKLKMLNKLYYLKRLRFSKFVSFIIVILSGLIRITGKRA